MPTPLLATSVGGLLLHAGVPFQLVAGGPVGPGMSSLDFQNNSECMRDHVDDTNSTSAQQVVEKEFNTERLFVPDPHALGQLLRPPGALAANSR